MVHSPVPAEVDPVKLTAYRMAQKHTSLQNLYNEWFGLDKYADEYGGICGRNLKFGKAWRRHLNGQQYSRTSRIVEGIEKYADNKIMGPADAISCLEKDYVASGMSIAKLVRKWQQDGLLPKGKKRGVRGPAKARVVSQ